MELLTFDDISPESRLALKREFLAARPFRHVVLDNVVRTPANVLLSSFPEASWQEWETFRDEYQKFKAVCPNAERVPRPMRDVLEDLNSPSMLRFLEDVTGIPKLLPDPYFEGGGLHMSGEGGILAPHTDFHWNMRLGLFRRVNVLIYLNETWHQDWGGSLEFYEGGIEQGPETSILPIWARCVIFQTDDRSVHGFTSPVAPGHTRRSVAAYYYTSSEAPEYSGDTTTYWRRHEGVGRKRLNERMRLRSYKTLILASRGIAKMAHRVNPYM